MALVMMLMAMFTVPPEMRYRKHGLAYIVTSLMCFSAILALLYFCSREEALIPPHLSTLVSGCLCLLPPMLYWPCRQHVLVFFSRHLSITIHAISQQAGLEKAEGPQPKQLKCISSNYFAEEEKASEQGSSIALADSREKVQCSVCLAADSTMVAMPCGHLSTCFDCMTYYVETNNSACLLCKGPIKKIYRISNNDPSRSPQVIEQLTIKMK